MPDIGPIQNLFANASALLKRSRLGAQLGHQYGGDRKLYDALGYKQDPVFEDYNGFYERQEIAGRVVDLPAQDTWRHPPIIIDGDARTDNEETETEFTKAFSELADKRRLWHYLERLDRLSGIGRFGALWIGTGGDLKQPVNGQENKVVYLAPHSEASVKIKSINNDPNDERFSLPAIYEFELEDAATDKTEKKDVHWSRVIHVADGKTTSEIYGTPRLQRILNRLYDLEKVLGSSSEAAWLAAFKGLAFILKDDFEFPDKTETGADAQEALIEEIQEYTHNLTRFMRLQGMEIQELGTETVPNPEGLVGVLIQSIAAGADIPNRILVGSERGELASSQDQATWAGWIASRQTTFAEPEILRPFIDWCIKYGALPQPKSGKYDIEWEPIFELNALEKGELARLVGDALYKASGGIPDLIMRYEDFAERYLDYTMPEGEFPRQPGDTDVDV